MADKGREATGRTGDIYDEHAERWISEREPAAFDDARWVGAEASGPVADLGCGPGWHLKALGPHSFGLDAAPSMVACALPERAAVRADLEALPFARRSLGGAWASKSYVHLPRARVPLALHDLHRSLRVGAPVGLHLLVDDRPDLVTGDDDLLPGRLFSFWPEQLLGDVLAGAGFEVVSTHRRSADEEVAQLIVRARRLRTLADTVGPGMRVLLVGLNPSLTAADEGYGFAGRSNRFWPAALASGLVSAERDPVAALTVDGVGMTDLCKRATRAAAEVRPAEFREGLGRLARLAGWLGPGVICVVGITGWRAASGDREAIVGPQPSHLGGRPVYVMPNPSGLNAHTNHDDLVAHFRQALRIAGRRRVSS